jgi:aspartyl-tRNA(Asn)/glutamyl-tRNA(Gln) amidotransferase subunit A
MDEFAMGSSGEHSAFGATRNPWDRARVPGGSSSGSAAAVAARLVPGALGSDTGGSIRQPAGYCGIVGLKPTYSRVSRYGLVAFASSLDQIGPLTRTVEDAAIVLSVIAGHDPLDSTSADLPVIDYTTQLDEPIDGLRLGVPREAVEHGNDPSVVGAFAQAIETFRTLGAEIIDVDLPHLEHAIDAYYIVAPAEASSNLARYDGIRYGRRAALGPGEDLNDLYARSRAEGFGAEVRRRIMLGTHVLSSGYYDAYYLTALKVRRLVAQDFERVFSGTGPDAHDCHAILMPTAPTPAFPIGAKSGDPLSMYLEDVYTVPANMAGLPAISVPMGFAESGSGTRLPLGLQIYGPHFEEHRLLRIARMFELATEFVRAPGDQ